MTSRALLTVWLYAPLVAVALGVGYATHHVEAAGIGLGVYATFITGLVIWGRHHRQVVRERIRRDPGYQERLRKRSDKLTKFFALWLAGSLGFLVLVVIADIVYRLVRR